MRYDVFSFRLNFDNGLDEKTTKNLIEQDLPIILVEEKYKINASQTPYLEPRCKLIRMAKGLIEGEIMAPWSFSQTNIQQTMLYIECTLQRLFKGCRDLSVLYEALE